MCSRAPASPALGRRARRQVPQFCPTLAMVFGVPEALTIAQVLLIDIGTDIWTAIAYAFQPAESKLMARTPRHPKLVKLADWGVGVYSYCYIGILQAFFCWVMFFQVPGLIDIWHQQGTGPYSDAKDRAAYRQVRRMLTPRGLLSQAQGMGVM